MCNGTEEDPNSDFKVGMKYFKLVFFIYLLRGLRGSEVIRTSGSVS